MNCCNHDCDQGRSCATRKTRRVRAGQPVGDDTGCLPVQYTKEQLDDWEADDRASMRDVVWIVILSTALTWILVWLLFDLMGV